MFSFFSTPHLLYQYVENTENHSKLYFNSFYMYKLWSFSLKCFSTIQNNIVRSKIHWILMFLCSKMLDFEIFYSNLSKLLLFTLNPKCKLKFKSIHWIELDCIGFCILEWLKLSSWYIHIATLRTGYVDANALY